MLQLPEYCQEKQSGKHRLIVIDAPFGKGNVSLTGAQLLNWTPAGSPPLIWLSPQADFDSEKSLRGGVPVCWPWFGPAQTPGLPQHGMVRNMQWQLDLAETVDEGVRLSFSVTDDHTSRDIWPHPFRLSLQITLGASISLDFEICHHGERELPIGFALHSYFAVPDALGASVTGLDSSLRHDKISGQRIVQAGVLRPGAGFDSVFTGASGSYQIDRTPWPAIEIKTEGAPSAIVWNPGPGSPATGIANEWWQSMLCVETGAALNDQLILAPGQPFTSRTIISTERMHG